jgi:hypothetical protein
VDYVAAAVARARVKAVHAGPLRGQVRFLRGDVTQLRRLDLTGPFQLLFDLGCLHSLSREGRATYAADVTQLASTDAHYWLYALAPTRLGNRMLGMTPDDVAACFAPAWTVARTEPGTNPNGRPSAWYWLQRST